MNRPPRVAAIHDLSGFGRCSLTVILPILSAMGVQVCPVPTAVLSSHTGGLGTPQIRDLTDFISPTLSHYKELDIEFECVYSGFLASEEQVDHCLEFFKQYDKSLIVVDPVMGDHGKSYKTYTPKMQKRMGELVRAADVITPNLTEAYMLLGKEYSHAPHTRSELKSMLANLSQLGPNFVIITGVELASGEMANVGYDRKNNSYWCVIGDYVPASYPGTGDIYSAVLVGSFLRGDSLPMAMDRATGFVETTVKTTFSYGSDTRYGVMLEKSLSWLTNDQVLKNFKVL